jgi:hypothetical protein
VHDDGVEAVEVLEGGEDVEGPLLDLEEILPSMYGNETARVRLGFLK